MQALPSKVCSSEKTLPRHMRHTQTHLKTNTFSFFTSYLHKIDTAQTPITTLPLAKQAHTHNTSSTANTYAQCYHPWMWGQTLARLLALWNDRMAAEQITGQSDLLHSTEGGG